MPADAMMSTAALAPTDVRERIQTLDVLRGFALLGIALMNVEFFSRPLADLGRGLDPQQPALDYALSWLIYVFVQGKFWVLFALLFGMGFALMQQRAQAAGRAFAALYLRRSFGLLAIGLLHAVLIWAGDILVSYALGAIVVLWLRHLPDEARWRWGATLYGLPTLALLALATMLVALRAAGMSVDDAPDAVQRATEEAARAAEIAAYSHGSWWQATRVRWDYLLGNIGEMLVFEVLVVGVYLFGSWLLRSGAMTQPQAHAGLLRGLRWIAGPVGVGLALLSAAVGVQFDWDRDGARAMLAMALMLAASPLMSLGYLAWLLWALQTTVGRRVLGVFAPAGRMALSNYLLQSLLGTGLFYGYGLGLWGQVPRRWQVLGVLVVVVLQLVASRCWLAHFRHGPVEWLWRAVTYGRFAPMRVAAASTP